MAKCALSRVHVLFISPAIAESGIFTSGLFIVVVLRGNTPYSLYSNISLYEFILSKISKWPLVSALINFSDCINFMVVFEGN